MDSYITNDDLGYLIQLAEVAVTIPEGSRSDDVRNYMVNNIMGKFLMDKSLMDHSLNECADEQLIRFNSDSTIKLIAEAANNPVKLLSVLKGMQSVTEVTTIIEATPVLEPIKTVNTVQLESRVLTNISRMIRVIDSREVNIHYDLISSLIREIDDCLRRQHKTGLPNDIDDLLSQLAEITLSAERDYRESENDDLYISRQFIDKIKNLFGLH